MKPTIISVEQWYNDKVQEDWFLPDLKVSTVKPETFQSLTATWYLKNCWRTWNKTTTYAMSFANASLGLVGEYAEVLNSEKQTGHTGLTENSYDDLVKEIGDCCYYLAIYKYLLGMPTIFRYSRMPQMSDTQVFMTISEFGKKAAFHRKFDGRYIESALHTIEEKLYRLSLDLNIDIKEIEKINIDKLYKRHGESFNGDYES